MLRRSLKVVVAPLLRVLAESDGGCVLKDDKACSIEETTVPNQDDLPFDGCEGDVLMCLFVHTLEHDSVLLVRIGFSTACAPTVILSVARWGGRR